MASLPAAAGFLLVVFSVILYGCCGQDITRYNITPDSCDHCLTLDEFASNNTNESVALFLSPGNHTLTRNIEIVRVDQFSILADTSVTIQCASPASFLFEGISNLEIRNTAVVSCGGGGSSGALQVKSVKQFDFNNVTLQESANISLNVQDSNGLVTGARFIGNAGAGVNITNSTVVFDGNNTFSDNLDGGIASYDSTLEFIGVNQFTSNTATSGGGISAISSTINCSGNMTFEYNSAEKFGGGVYLSGTRMTIESHIRFIGNTQANHGYYYRGGGGLCAVDHSVVNINAESNFINNSAEKGGGLSAYGATVNINAESNFINNSAERNGGGLSAHGGTVNINAESNFINNSAEDGGGLCALYARVNINAESNFINNSAERGGGGLLASSMTRLDINAESNFINNSAERGGGLSVARAGVNINAESNFISNSAELYGGGLNAWGGAAVNINAESNFISNSAGEGGGLFADWSTVNISRESNFMYNSAQQDGGGVFVRNSAIVNVNGTSNFMYNSAQRYGGAVFLRESEVHISDNSSFTMNSASLRGGGMCLQTNSIAYIRDGFFSDNWSMYGGGISILQSEIMLQGRTVFSNNNASYGGAIQAFEANINVTGNVDFTKNLATVSGGALALDGYSVVYIFETALLTFVENRAASFGGAIYNNVHCSYDWKINGFIGIYDSTGRNEYFCREADSDLPSCFNTKLASFKDKINLAFSGNSATAGSAIFGGEIDEAITNIMFYYDGNTFTTTVADLFQYLFSVSINESNAQPTISSNPARICGCINDQPDYSDTPSPYEVTVYPGQTVGVSLVAVGQRNGTVPSATTAQYDPNNGATFRDLQSSQRIDHTTCTELHYTIISRKHTETFKIYVDSSCGSEGIPLSVNVTLLKCPIGFTLSNSSNQCVCEERLQKYTSRCDISNLEITRTASDDFWVGVDNTNGTEGLILHPHCPFDYCTTDTVNFTLGNASTNTVCTTENKVTVANGSDTYHTKGIDAQCNYNRSGLLCGKCQNGFSVVFGSSKCLKCSNSYLSLLIAFGLAGIVLVVFLLVLKLTVAVGTINGLIFYANIVSVNRAQLFPSGETNILTVFIAWVNLDLGIETCFIDGMDAYSKAWLQYAFPVYVWALVGAIILACRRSTRIARCLGTNPMAILATLFLLSYAKLLRSIINPLFFTFLEYPTDSKAVWLVDGNIPYLKGKHIPLFLTSLLALFLLFIPFTLLLLLGQSIQAQSERKCFKWISDYRISAFLDVYHGPFKNKHRYWSGLLLVARFCLFLVFAFNVNGDTSVNILAIAVCLIGLLVIILQFNAYKAWYLNVLEASFIINLLLLAIGTYYVKISEGNQSALTYTSVSVAFATFCGIVVYHSCLQIKDSNLFEKFIFALNTKSSADDSESDAPIYSGSIQIPNPSYQHHRICSKIT